MIRIVMEVNAPPDAIQGIKEIMAMYCERFGDSRIVSIQTDRTPQREPVSKLPSKPAAPTEQYTEQMSIGGKPWQQDQYPNRRR